MARIIKLTIEGFRSIKNLIEINFPQNMPLILIGENNAGKSNIVRAVDLLLGESWPGSHEPEDHEFWDRNPGNGPIIIRAFFDGMSDNGVNIEELCWKTNAENKPVYQYILEGGRDRYVKNEVRNQCTCFTISADRRLSYQLSYASKYTLLAKLMRKFHTKLTEDGSRIIRLKDKFNEIKTIFNEVVEFGSFQEELRNHFGQMFDNMSYGLQVDFSAYDPSNFFHSLRMQAIEGNAIRTLEELGTGQEQLLALAFAHAYAKAFYGGIFLAIEEPEAHLHPLAQEWLAKKIKLMCSDGLQLMITTHSPTFVDILGLSGFVLVEKTDCATSICQITSDDLVQYCLDHGSNTDHTNSETILPFYEGSATQEIKSGFFAKKIVLVEGITESMTLPIYLNKVGLDVSKEGIAVIPVMGKGNLAKWWRFFTAYEKPTYIIFDNDSNNDEEYIKRKDALTTLGLNNETIKATVVLNSLEVFNLFAVFGLDYESCMRNSFKNYRVFETTARDELGDSKPLVARWIADKIERDDNQIGWRKILELASALQNLGNEDVSHEIHNDIETP